MTSRSLPLPAPAPPAAPALNASRARARWQFALRTLTLGVIASACVLGYLRAMGLRAGFDWPQIGVVFGWGSLVTLPATLAVGLWMEGPPLGRSAVAMLSSAIFLGAACVTAWTLALPNLPVPMIDWRSLWGG